MQATLNEIFDKRWKYFFSIIFFEKSRLKFYMEYTKMHFFCDRFFKYFWKKKSNANVHGWMNKHTKNINLRTCVHILCHISKFLHQFLNRPQKKIDGFQIEIIPSPNT